MENLNAEAIKSELEGLVNFLTCPEYIKDALALINSQEQRIGAQDMIISELRQRTEKAEHDADRYARKIKELTEDNERVSAENDELCDNIACLEIDKENAERRTVRKMQERLKERLDISVDGYSTNEVINTIFDTIDQIAKEMLDDNT